MVLCSLQGLHCCEDQSGTEVAQEAAKLGYGQGITCAVIKAHSYCNALVAHKRKDLCQKTCDFCSKV